MESLKFSVDLDSTAFSQGLKRLEAGIDSFGGSAATIAGAVATVVGGLTTGIAGFGAMVASMGSEMEGMETKLQVLMGSAEAGTARFKELFQIGASTPFELGPLIEAETTLRALGANAEETLPLVLDFAGAMGTDLTSAALDVGRAMQFGAGAVETLAGRALRAQVEIRTGQDALKMSTADFREELVKTLTDPQGMFAGGTKKLSATFSGMTSNLADEWTKFGKAINDSGFFAAVKAGLGAMLKAFDDNRDAVNGLAKNIGLGLYSALRVAMDAVIGLAEVWGIFAPTTERSLNAIIGLAAVLASKMASVGRAVAEAELRFLRMEEAITGANLDAPIRLAQEAAQKLAQMEGAADKQIREALERQKELNAEIQDAEMHGSEFVRQMKGAAEAIDKAFAAAQSSGKAMNETLGGKAPGDPPDPEKKGGGNDQLMEQMRQQEELLAQMAANAAAAQQEIGLTEEAIRRQRFDRELAETQAQFDALIEMRRQANLDTVDVEAMAMQTIADMEAVFYDNERQMAAEATEAANQEIARKLQERQALYDRYSQQAVNTFEQFGEELVRTEWNIGATMRKMGADLLADLLAQLASFLATRAAIAAATGNIPRAIMYGVGAAAAATGSGVVRGMGAKAGGGETFHQGGAIPGDVPLGGATVQTDERLGVLNRGATSDLGLDEVGLRNLNHGGAGGGGQQILRIGSADIMLVEELSRIDSQGNGGFSRRGRTMSGSPALLPGLLGR